MKIQIVLILLFLIFSAFFLFVFFSDDSSQAKDYSEKENNKESGEMNLSDEEFYENNEGTEDYKETSGGAGGGVGEEESSKEEFKEQPICMLVRPGNLPDITCSVNYIRSDKISIKIKNEIGKELGVIINIDNCDPEFSEAIKNNQEMDFVFSCDNKDFFNEMVSISYIVDESEEVEIGGFIQGPVSSY